MTQSNASDKVPAGDEPAMGATLRRVVVMGVSASGKSAVGAALAARLGLHFVDGDDLHPPSNVAKMSSGTPLTDADRAPWLDRIGDELADLATHPQGVVLACSALRRSYRDRIRAKVPAGLVFAFLDVTKEEALRRIRARTAHFMPASLIDSQFATLERPDHEPDVVTVSQFGDVPETARDAAELIIRHQDAR